MNRKEANKQAQKIYEDWQKDRQQIEKDAKEKGKWQKIGLDSNNHLFKEADAKAKGKIEELSKQIIEE